MKPTSNVRVLHSLPYYERQLICVDQQDYIYGVKKGSETAIYANPFGKMATREETERVTKLSPADFTHRDADGFHQLFQRLMNESSEQNHTLTEAEFEAVRLHFKQSKVIELSALDAPCLKFPAGHPRPDTLYAAHPHQPDVYYPVKQFHHKTFEHKFHELVALLMSLGAVSIEVECQEGYGREIDTGLQAKGAGGQVGGAVEFGSTSRKDRMFQYAASFRPQGNPALPDGMVWYAHEPSWQLVADGRLKHGLTDFQLTLDYSEDYRINVELTLNHPAAGGGLHVEVDRFQYTRWVIAGAFAPAE